MSKVSIIYKPNSEHARAVEEYMRDFYRRTGAELDTIDPESRDGAYTCQVYDIVEYPSVIAVTNEGQLLSSWRGLPLPTINELSSYR